MRSTSPSSKPASSRRSLARPRTRPCAHGQALIPIASTPTTRRTLRSEAAAIPISATISCVGSCVTGVVRSSGYRAVDLHLGPQRALPVDDVARDVIGERLDEERLADHDLLDRLGEQLREA